MDLVEHRVTQSNRLVEASYTLTLNEKRLVLAAASQIDSRKPLHLETGITVRGEAFAAVFGLQPKHAYEVLREAASRLYDRTIREISPMRAGGKVESDVRWVWKAEYNEGMGSVSIFFTPPVLAHLTKLHREFTSYQLKQIGGLSTFYAVRLYEMCQQFHKIGVRHCPLEQLRDSLNLGDKYTDIRDLRKRVLDPSIKEINAQTDLRVEVEVMRQGRKTVGFILNIDRNDQIALDLADVTEPRVGDADIPLGLDEQTIA